MSGGGEVEERGVQLQECSRCVMDTSTPPIDFDADGQCTYCAIYDRRIATETSEGEVGWRRLEEIAARIRAERRSEYDCIIGVSGGVDSSYVALLTARLGLRPLAVHLDNGWNSELAVDNIVALLDHLDIDLMTHVVDWEEFRDIQLSFLRASVPNVEMPSDHAITALLYRTAREHGIRHLFSGGNIRTEGTMPASFGHDNRDLRHLKAIHRRFGSVPMRTLPTMSVLDWVGSLVRDRITMVSPLNLVDYDKDRAKKELQDEFGWRDYGGKHFESTFTKFFQAYILPTKFGLDKRRPHLSCLVRSGALSKADAHDMLATHLYDPTELRRDRRFVITKLGLTDEEFETIMALPPRAHDEFPAHRVLLGSGSAAQRLFRRFAKIG